MPMSSSAAFCYTLCQTASIVSATMASSPMAPEPTASLSVSGCLMAVTLVPASLPTIAAKAIARSPQPTSQSVPIAGAPCGRSQPCRAPATLSHSPVTRHDCPADVYDQHARPPRGQQCLHRYRVANQSLSSGMPSVPTLEINAIVPLGPALCPCHRSAGPPRPCLDQRRNPSDRGLDRTPDHRSIPLGATSPSPQARLGRTASPKG